MHQRNHFQTQQHLEQLRNGSNSMLVAIRCRPLSSKELLLSDFNTVKIFDTKMLVLLDPENEFKPEDVLRKNRNKEMQYAFDFAFDQTTNNEQLYARTTSFLLDGVLDGYNATIFAYGATGCGKTHTMVGSTDNPGVMPRCLTDLFAKTEIMRATKQVNIKVSYLEIYNENIKDLLISEDKNFDVREDPKVGIVIAGISQVPVNNMVEITALLRIGNRNRSKEATGANEASSRSHAVLQVTVQSSELNGSGTEIKTSKVSLVDLAGSERASSTSNRGMRMVEGAKINQSLLVLGNCIQALSDATEKGIRNGFIPYRGSKLTRLLKDSLGGNCRTVMIANVSPSVSSFEDTYNTLMYANRAKSIKTNAQRNVLNVENHLENYESIITTLKKENGQLKTLLHRNSLGNRDILPPIESSDQNSLALGFESECRKCFGEQIGIMKKISELEKEIDIQGFCIFRLQMDSSKPEVIRERMLNSKRLIEDINITKVAQQKKLKEESEKINLLIQEVKSSPLIATNQAYILSVIKQQQISLERQQIVFHQKKLENQNKEKESIISQLKTQLQQKDKIIEEQKILMQKNRIINRITYSNIKDFGEAEEEVKHTLPTLKVQSTRSNMVTHNHRIKSVDISVLDTEPERQEKVKPVKDLSRGQKGLQRVLPKQLSSNKYYYNKHVEAEMKMNQYRQKSIENLPVPPSPHKKKKIDYISVERVFKYNKLSQKSSQKLVQQKLLDQSHRTQPRQLLPNPLYIKRKKCKYERIHKHDSLNVVLMEH